MSTTWFRTFAPQPYSLAPPRGSRPLLALLSSIILMFSSACTTMRSVDPQSASAAEVQDELEAGDPVKVLLRDGRELDLGFERWTAEHFAGKDEADVLQAIPWQDISRLQVSRISGIRTGLLVLGVTGALVGIRDSVAAAAKL